MIPRDALPWLAVALVAALAQGLASCQPPDGRVAEDLRSVASACMRATACDVQPYARIGACMYTYEELRVQYGESAVMGGIYECVNQADRCSEVAACFGAGEPCDSSHQSYCDGDTAVYCDLLDGVTYRYACGDYGLGCRPDPYITHLASCVPVDQATASAAQLHVDLPCDGSLCTRTGEPCDDNTLDECSGEHIVACVEGEVIQFSCRALGLRHCIMESNGWGRCQPQIEPQ